MVSGRRSPRPAGALGVIVGADAELDDEQWGAGQLCMEALQHDAEPVGPDAVAEGRYLCVGRLDEASFGVSRQPRVTCVRTVPALS